ncbi:isopentenyl-diphosphate Delta-isomerase [Mycolicibacterium cyprinidarum]|uniref:Isopentenyl-diphosphate Delta-isomerase n=1 Tax=Mycolicibacterium cyprinidarum TaxID=2860311 RepID=A0ABQ4V722_9MYCO|nr:isopentenyl-diphosphate Delta-isomerase [Mycolicibacterium sp. NGTWSNA01]GJF15000.1 isopentenyl-diphosphate Delta-isomerase [Mycolicibacterium sp. NGTWS0302]GJF16796.1 isopentenyl-diphosphate Delta-isomerase [Mycolicibacterium sp. NGTWS1803]
MNSVQSQELVVLLDDSGSRIGIAPKAEVHHGSTPLHLAFSCYLFDDENRVLLTRRALAKRAFPGIWTNSVCGHPEPDEPVEDAVIRRSSEELGVDIVELRCVLPDFRYRAIDADGVAENEVCPVFCARVVGSVNADPSEIMDVAWVTWDQLRAAAQSPGGISPWAAEQIPLLEDAGVGTCR